MKKLKIITLVMMFAFPTTFSGNVIADETIATPNKLIVFKINHSSYYTHEIGSSEVRSVQMDTAPFIKDSRTFVAVRFLGNALGVSTMVLFVMMVMLVCMTHPAFADMQPIFETISPDQIADISMNDDWDKMTAISNPDNTFKEIEYYVKSTGPTSGIRYRTKEITFRVGQYGPASYDASKLLAGML